MKFILDTNWIFQDPIDYEHKQYVLLAYLKKISDKLNDFELYPYFIEISLHLANTQTLLKENMFITTKKVFKSTSRPASSPCPGKSPAMESDLSPPRHA